MKVCLQPSRVQLDNSLQQLASFLVAGLIHQDASQQVVGVGARGSELNRPSKLLFGFTALL